MTRERAFELGTEAAAWHPDLNAARRIAKAILTVVAEENEACAKIAGNHQNHESDAVNHARGPSTCPEAIAAEIRARRGQ